MTTTVIVQAHCSKDKEVVIQRYGQGQSVEEIVIQDGEEYTDVVYDGIACSVYERVKKESQG